MKIIYYSYYGCYSSLLLAYIHINKNNKILKKDFFKIPYLFNIDYGQLRYIGIDSDNNQIYAIGMKNFSDNIKKTLNGVMKIFNINDKVVFIDTSLYDIKFLKVFLLLRKIGFMREFIDNYLYDYVIKNYDNIKLFVYSNKNINNINSRG